jgi:hypothetical protein
MRAVKFLAKYSAAVTNSPPNTRSNQRDVHDPNEWADVPYKHSRTLQNKRKRRNSNWITTAQTTDETNCCPEKYLKIVALKNYLPLQERSVLDTWERHQLPVRTVLLGKLLLQLDPTHKCLKQEQAMNTGYELLPGNNTQESNRDEY